MAPSDPKLEPHIPLAPPSQGSNDTYRVKSIATRLTEAELSEVESAASKTGKKVSEWLRDAALAQIRGPKETQTDPVLLAEIVGMKSLMLNLFAKASLGPLSVEELRKMSAYADSIKEDKARELLARKQPQNSEK